MFLAPDFVKYLDLCFGVQLSRLRLTRNYNTLLQQFYTSSKTDDIFRISLGCINFSRWTLVDDEDPSWKTLSA